MFHTVYYYPPTPKRVRLGKFETEAEAKDAISEHAKQTGRDSYKVSRRDYVKDAKQFHGYQIKSQRKTRREKRDELEKRVRAAQGRD
jgi:hypothetical protein